MVPRIGVTKKIKSMGTECVLLSEGAWKNPATVVNKQPHAQMVYSLPNPNGPGRYITQT